MYIAYLIACIPLIVGAILWIFNRNIVWWEWLVSALAGFVVAILFNVVAVSMMTYDTEMWSGKIDYAIYQPEWVEQYQQSHTETDSNGNTRTYYTTEYRTHSEEWTATANYGSRSEEYNISPNMYQYILQKFGKKEIRDGDRPGYYSGDTNDYYAINVNGFVIPTNTTYSFENRIKAAPSLFSFVKVPKDIKGLYEWPSTIDHFMSNRLLGVARKSINIDEFDKMCTRLGPVKKVNVIIIGYGANSSPIIAKYQEAKWIGGKKNDLVLCYGGSDNLKWSYVFGWTEKEDIKRNLESLLLNNEINTNLLPAIEDEITRNYEIKEWAKFNYIAVEPPGWSYWILILVMGIVQVIIWVINFRNEYNKRS